MLISILHKLYAFKGYGILTQLVASCFSMSIPFFVMLFIWIMAFTLIFMCLGIDFDFEDHYEGIPIFFAYFFQTIENSIGNIKTPTYSQW